jgi:hypothetical protein
VNAKTLIARGRALYVSRLAAWVCSATGCRRATIHVPEFHAPQLLLGLSAMRATFADMRAAKTVVLHAREIVSLDRLCHIGSHAYGDTYYSCYESPWTRLRKNCSEQYEEYTDNAKARGDYANREGEDLGVSV